MRLVYQNDENPFFKSDVKAANKFEGIVNDIKEMLYRPISPQINDGDNLTDHAEQTEIIEYDDECDRTISSVFDYDEKDYGVELIVRPVHIQVQFPQKNEELENLYKNLFVFFREHVVPELEKFCLKYQENVKNFNIDHGFLSDIKDLNIELLCTNNLLDLTADKYVIVTSNIPKLCFVNFYTCLHEKYGNHFDTHNVFITSEALEKPIVLKKFKDLLKIQNNPITAFLDCSKEIPKKFKLDKFNDFSKIIFIVSSTSQRDSLVEKINLNLNIQNIDINFNWIDLKPESKKKILRILYQVGWYISQISNTE